MRSTRLPGKVMKKLANRSVLSHVLERCRAVPGVDRVICATVASPECDIVADEAQRCGVDVFRGDEADVLGRYRLAAKDADAETVLRVTSDCPLIDPEVCGAVIAALQQSQADFASNNEPKSWPHGLDCEAFTFAWLDKAAREATSAHDREHVGPYMRNHPQARKINVACPAGDLSRHRWTLDTPEDFAFLGKVFAALPSGRAGWSWRAALDVVGH